MEHRRCTRCRNPIRTGHAVSRFEKQTESWFHADCWQEVQQSAQLDYERQIAASGLAAAIAPYCNRA